DDRDVPRRHRADEPPQEFPRPDPPGQRHDLHDRDSVAGVRGTPSYTPSDMAEPTSQAVRRALARAESGKALTADEVTALLAARGDDLERLLGHARHLRELGHGTTVTYSRKVFIPLTMLCRDHCHYCTFAKPPARLDHAFLTPEQVVAIADAGRERGCKEALFTLGDKPEERYP